MSAYSDAVLALNPVGYWRLGETAGTTANDESSNNNDATYSGLYTQGITGALAGDSDKAARMSDGQGLTSTKVEAPRIAAYEITSTLTIALWVKPNGYPGGSNRAALVYNDNSSDPWPYDFAYNGILGWEDAYVFTTAHGASRHLLWSYGDQRQPTVDQYGDGDEFYQDEWAFAVCTYDGTTKKMYKNGCLIAYVNPGLGNITGFNVNSKMRIGMGPFGNDGTWNWMGYVDEVSVFDTVLTEGQIQNLYGIGVDFTGPGCYTVPEQCSLTSSDEVLFVDATYQDVTVTLWPDEDLHVSHIQYIKRIDGTTNTVTIIGDGVPIDRQQSMVLMPRDGIAVYNDGTEWWVL